MFIVTNRMVNEQARPQRDLWRNPQRGPQRTAPRRGPRQGKQWQLDLLPDRITAEMAASVGIDPGPPHPASAYVARKLFGALRRDRQHGPAEAQDRQTPAAVRFAGFNNDLDDVLERAAGLEARYGVEVLSTSAGRQWRRRQGVLSYKSDKRDALASAGAP